MANLPSIQPGPNRNVRSQLRQATYIDPQTGSRRKRRVNLYSFDGQNGQAPDDPAERLPRWLIPQRLRGGNGGSQAWRKTVTYMGAVWEFIRSDTGKGVLKCSLAYLLGSMATFVPFLSRLFGQQDSKHLVATITVYFHPARSLGSMFDALILAFSAFLYTAFISVTSMGISVLLGDTLHRMVLAHTIVLFFFVGGGLGFIGWFKVRMNDPLVNVACSLASLSLITVLTKEGAVQAADFSFRKIAQILNMIIAGVFAVMLVSIFIFPISARQRLKEDFVEVTDGLSEMLALVTNSFITGDEQELENQEFRKASERHRKAFGRLAQNLKESKYEHYFFGTEREHRIEGKLVHCIQRLTQSIGGLRSAATMQFTIIKQPALKLGHPKSRNFSSFGSTITTPSFATAQPGRTFSGDVEGSMLASIAETPEEELTETDATQMRKPPKNGLFPSPSEIFELFISHLGPSMRSLAYTLKEILEDLPFDPEANYAITTNPRFGTSLDRALDLYRDARASALKVVYDKKDMDRNRPLEVEADWEETAASCGYFSSSLEEVAKQMQEYLEILDEMQLELEEMPAGRTWSWMKFWHITRNRFSRADLDPDLAPLLDHTEDLDHNWRMPQRKMADYIVPEARQSVYKQKLFRSVYEALSFMRRDDIKFAIKVGFGAVIYALPAFIDATRPTYTHWRGEWGLLSYMLVCSMTIGASNTTGYSRFLGTCVGAILAILAWVTSNGNAYAMACFGFLMAYWTAYIIVGKGKGPMGRFIMLTYNLSALYAYSLSVDDEAGDDGDEEDTNRRPLIIAITIHRVVAVLTGCVWGLIVTRLVWPISAREKLRDGLSLLWLRMGVIWRRDPLSVFMEPAERRTESDYMNLREEMEFSRFLAQLKGLVDAAKSEFELRGPFPAPNYNRILDSTQRMLDAFHAMNAVILKDPKATEGEERLLRQTIKERKQLCARIGHLFGVMASSMKMQYPVLGGGSGEGEEENGLGAVGMLEGVRDRLLARVFVLRKRFRRDDDDDEGGGKGVSLLEDDHGRDAEQPPVGSVDQQDPLTAAPVRDEDFSLLYTYALVTGQIGQEIRTVLREIEDLFGVLDEELLRLQ